MAITDITAVETIVREMLAAEAKEQDGTTVQKSGKMGIVKTSRGTYVKGPIT